MEFMNKFLIFISLLFSPVLYSSSLSSCWLNGVNLYGKVKVVEHFATFKVKVVRNFADLKVKEVAHFADKCGEWQFVNNFEDFSIQYVDAFEDFSIMKVDNFPGID